jgi:hypothetical protein
MSGSGGAPYEIGDRHYNESPFERIVDVHWKKKDDGGGPPPKSKSPCYSFFDSTNPFGQGSQHWGGPFQAFYVENGTTWINWVNNPDLHGFYNYSFFPPVLWPNNVASESCPGEFPGTFAIPPMWAWHDYDGPTANYPQGMMLNGGIGSTVIFTIYGDNLLNPRWSVWEDTCLSDFVYATTVIPPTYQVDDWSFQMTVPEYGSDPHPVPTPPYDPGTVFYCGSVVRFTVDAHPGYTLGIRAEHLCDGPNSRPEGECAPPFFRALESSEARRRRVLRPVIDPTRRTPVFR